MVLRQYGNFVFGESKQCETEFGVPKIHKEYIFGRPRQEIILVVHVVIESARGGLIQKPADLNARDLRGIQ